MAQLRARRESLESEITDLKAKTVRTHSQARLLHSMAEGLGRFSPLATAPTDPVAYQSFLTAQLNNYNIQ